MAARKNRWGDWPTPSFERLREPRTLCLIDFGKKKCAATAAGSTRLAAQHISGLREKWG
jgi:hypothetical protein